MQKTTVVSLRNVRDMLSALDNARKLILSGAASGVQTTLRTADGAETVAFAGTYGDDPATAVRAVFKASVLRQDEEEGRMPAARVRG